MSYNVTTHIDHWYILLLKTNNTKTNHKMYFMFYILSKEVKGHRYAKDSVNI